MDHQLQEICEAYRARLAGKRTGWCQLYPGQDERRWTTQQVVEHLVLTLRGTAQVLETRLEKGRPTRARTTLLQRARRLATLSLGWIPRGMPAPPFARPGLLHWPAMGGAELADLLRRELENLDGLLDRGAAQFGKQAAGSHFLLGPMSAKQWRRFHTVHCRHHLGQLERIATAVGPNAQEPEPAAK